MTDSESDHPQSPSSMQELVAQLATMATNDEKLAAVSSHLTQMAPEGTTSFALRSGTSVRNPGGLSTPSQSTTQAGTGIKHTDHDATSQADVEAFGQAMGEHGFASSVLSWLQGASGGGLFQRHALECAPCANSDPGKSWKCTNTANLRECSNCRLVLYCSKDCQRKHWKIHKQDCKDAIRAKDWVPAWVSERRRPSFITGEGSWPSSIHPLGLGMALWGNMPAQDIVNLANNEVDPTKDMDLVFAASGDLRNVLYTVNKLPDDYSGKLTIVINDINPYVVIRNLLILRILCGLADKERSCDMALHVWYSAYLPEDYACQLQAWLLGTFTSLVENDGVMHSDLGDGEATLSAVLSRKSLVLAYQIADSDSVYGVTDIANEINRVRFASARIDRHHRNYCRMEPSHRLASLEFRRFGLVLPFGAANNWFNTPNRLLFSPEGRWLQDDLADPLDSWDPVAVIEAGKRHGVQRADLYGCLYFYLTEQLREFASRISRFKIAFKMFDQNALNLAPLIQSGALSRVGIPAEQRFDRVDVSNIMDKQYAGIQRTLASWDPLIKDTGHAALIGYFMNWGADNDYAARAGKNELGPIIERATAEGKIPKLSGTESVIQQINFGLALPAYYNVFTALHDNSEAFEQYLASEGFQAALDGTKLCRKPKHTILSHRLYTPLEAPLSALPVFQDQEMWYLRTSIGAPMWSERYLEFSKA